MPTESERIYQGFIQPYHHDDSDERRVGPKQHFMD